MSSRSKVAVQPTLGARLRAIRQARKRSLADVAAATGISVSFLSLVESGGSDLTIGRLLRLAEYYGVPLTELFPLRNDRLVIRAGEHVQFTSPDERQDVWVLSPEGSQRMTPLLIVFAPGGGAVERSVHEGEEFWYVLEGTAYVEIEGSEPITLNPGDTMYFPADRPHSIGNAGETPLRLLAVVTPALGSLLRRPRVVRAVREHGDGDVA